MLHITVWGSLLGSGAVIFCVLCGARLHGNASRTVLTVVVVVVAVVFDILYGIIYIELHSVCLAVCVCEFMQLEYNNLYAWQRTRDFVCVCVIAIVWLWLYVRYMLFRRVCVCALDLFRI